MKIGIIVGSNRASSESRRIAEWFYKELHARDIETELVDFHDTPISFVPEEIWDGLDENFNAIKSRLIDCDGFVLVTPEWGGSASPVMKNAMIFLGSSVFADKPAYLVGVSDGRGGLRPILDMRSFGFKNSYVCYIPEWLVVTECKTHFQLNEENSDDYIVGRAKYGITTLLTYSTALATVRAQGIRDLDSYAFGM
jgi:azobenzene reductase